MQKWINDKDSSIYSTHDEGKSAVTEKFIRTLKSNIHNKWQLLMKNPILAI